MCFFKRIKCILYPSLDPDLEQSIRTSINGFHLAISRLSSSYTSKSAAKELSQLWGAVYDELKDTRIPQKHPLYSEVQQFFSEYEHLQESIAASNDIFIAEEKRRYNVLLSSIDGKSLDDEQRTAVVTDEDRNLVIAGAGSGKTLTIAGKVKYLCDAKGTLPEDILLIAFTRKSAEEMSERISGRLGLPVRATTFHKLGLDIISTAKGKRPDVQDSLMAFIREYFEKKILDDHSALKNIVRYFAYYLHIPANMEEFDSLGAAYEAEKSADLETLRGKYERAKYVADAAKERGSSRQTLKNEQVKSLDEVSIANFLFLKGVRYEYETLYPFESDDPFRKAYRPDFYLPDYDLYIEHFGIDRNGKAPWLSEIEEKKYLEDIVWKRMFHKKNGTKLLETYSYYTSEGRLTEKLERLLIENGVLFKEPDFEDIFETIYSSQSDKIFSEFIRLCCTFITLFKSGGYTPDELADLRSSNPAFQKAFFWKRTALFLRIIRPILHDYNASLADRDSLDFPDMINKAAKLVEDGFKIHPYKWIIVDEYQDISAARYKLVKAILDQTGAKILCVGDDWQSIYRFAGSDIALFTHFDRYFGSPAIMRLEQTYRNSQNLIDEAGAFIMKNPQQYSKNLRSSKQLDYPIVFLFYEDHPFSVLQMAVNKIIRSSGPDASILLLGRTNYDLEMLWESKLFQLGKSGSLTYLASPSTPVSFLTVHRSKGLEADNVILLNFENATLGFPNKIADDPLLELVLKDGDKYPNAEERRLLYVALTRTRNRAFVLVNKSRPSEFMQEFHYSESSKSVFIWKKGAQPSSESIACPKCKTGRLIAKKNHRENRYFVGCSHFPMCDFSVPDASVLEETKYCPRCGGFLIKRRGKRGSFYGCSYYPVCTYTTNADL